MMSHEGPFWMQIVSTWLHFLEAVSTYELVETLRGTETSRSHANDEDVNVARMTC